jgi:hypothetical protein
MRRVVEPLAELKTSTNGTLSSCYYRVCLTITIIIDFSITGGKSPKSFKEPQAPQLRIMKNEGTAANVQSQR